MSNLFSIKYVPSSALLPETLVQGRLYFVGDEQVIILDSGDGPKIYGATSSPATYIHSDSSPSLKEQIDTLAAAELQSGINYWTDSVKMRKEIARLEARVETLTASLQEQATQNATGILHLQQAIQAEAEKTDTEIATLAKTITKIHPYVDPDDPQPVEPAQTPQVIETLRGGDEVTVDGQVWEVQEITNSDGTISVRLVPKSE